MKCFKQRSCYNILIYLREEKRGKDEMKRMDAKYELNEMGESMENKTKIKIKTTFTLNCYFLFNLLHFSV